MERLKNFLFDIQESFYEDQSVWYWSFCESVWARSQKRKQVNQLPSQRIWANNRVEGLVRVLDMSTWNPEKWTESVRSYDTAIHNSTLHVMVLFDVFQELGYTVEQAARWIRYLSAESAHELRQTVISCWDSVHAHKNLIIDGGNCSQAVCEQAQKEIQNSLNILQLKFQSLIPQQTELKHIIHDVAKIQAFRIESEKVARVIEFGQHRPFMTKDQEVMKDEEKERFVEKEEETIKEEEEEEEEEEETEERRGLLLHA
jgi:hypothetical protein